MATENSISNNKRIAKNTIFLSIRMLFSMAVSLYTTRAILEILGVTDFGIYNVVGGVIVFLGFLNQTMSTTTARFITTALGKGDQDYLHGIFCMSMNFHMILSILTLIVGETIGLWIVSEKLIIPADRMPAAMWLYQASILSACIGILNVPYNSTIIAHERMGAFAYISIMQVIAKLLIVLVLPFFMCDRLILFSLLMVIVSIIIQVAYWQYSYRAFEEVKYKPIWNNAIWKDIIGFTSWNISCDLAFMCNTQGLNILLNIFFGPIVNVARGIAVQIESIMRQFVGNFQTAINPQITKKYAGGQIDESLYLVLRVSRFCFYIIMLMGIPLYFEIEYLLKVWLGNIPEYTISFAKITILMVVIDGLSNPLHLLIYASGKVKTYQIILSSIYLIFLPLSYCLIKFYSVSPEVILTMLLLFKTVMVGVRIKRINSIVGMKIQQYLTEVLFPIVLCLFLAVIVPIVITVLFEQSFIRFVGTTVFAVLSSLQIIYFVGLRISERELVKQYVKKIVFKINCL